MEAAEGAPFSPRWVPPSQAQGRFDLPGAPGGVMYLAETPVHAVAEMIQHFRGHALDAADLRVAGHPLALVRAEIVHGHDVRFADLCRAALLVELGIEPDETASVDRQTTQRIAARVHAEGYAGLRWWSALRGDWHTLVLFRERLSGALRFDTPAPLSVTHPTVQEAMRELGMIGRRPNG